MVSVILHKVEGVTERERGRGRGRGHLCSLVPLKCRISLFFASNKLYSFQRCFAKVPVDSGDIPCSPIPLGDRPIPLGDRSIPLGDRPIPVGDRPISQGGRQN